jgi:ligand-binding sensor domain-containing protein
MIAGASAQTYRLFTTENGLTSSLVNYIYEDRYGLIWIASEDGLNKYDGVKITSYKHREGDESSLASNYVSMLIEDAQGNLIVSTYNGLQIYRHDTDDFSPVGATPEGKLMKVNINRLMLEKDGRLYGTGDVSCEIRTKGKDRIEVLRMAKPYFSSQTTDEFTEKRNIRTTLRYDDSHLLLGTDGDGVKLYDEIKRTYIDYPLDIPNIPQQLQKVHHLMRDRSGNLWIALYQKGIVMMSRHKGMFGYIGSRTSQKNLIGSHCVQSIVKSRNGGMWVGTDGDGLYYLEGNKSQHISEGVPPMINALMEDSE